MARTFRVGTFNMENLFSRIKALNLLDNSKTTSIFNDVTILEQLLAKTTYSLADKAQILKLSASLASYIEIQEDKGRLFSGNIGNQRVIANGAGDWSGQISFRRADISNMARESTAEVVNNLKADVLCCVEVEDRQVLQSFNKGRLKSPFDYAMLIDGNDPRGINVGLLSRFELGAIRTHIFDVDAKRKTIFSRDCLEVELKLKDGRSLYILCNHLKSQGYGDSAANDARRFQQATRLAAILSRYNLARDLVIVAGDMNDDPTSPALKPLVSVPNLFDVLALQFPNPKDRWTYLYDGKRNQIDFLLVSKPLKAGFKQAVIERRGLYGVKEVTPFPSVKTAATAASDHGGIVAEFSV